MNQGVTNPKRRRPSQCQGDQPTSPTAPDAEALTSRDALRWIGVLTILEGMALVLGGRDAVCLGERLAPDWYRFWLRPLVRLSPSAVRLLGAFEAAFGLQLLAMTPPAPGITRAIARTVLEPVGAIWDVAVAARAESRFSELLRQFVPPGARILDLGCGEGDNLARLLDEDLPFGSYLGLDRSPAVLARARARFAGIPKIEFERNDLLNDQLPTGEFDLILSAWALDHLEDPFVLIVRALRQLRQGGHAMLLFVSPPRDWRAGPARLIARRTGHHLYPASIYHGLPGFTAEQEFSNGLISLVILQNPLPVPSPIAASPPETTPG